MSAEETVQLPARRTPEVIEVEAEALGPPQPPPRMGAPKWYRWIPGSTTVVALAYFLVDDEAPTTKRFLTLLSIIYLISPIDLLPDWFFPLLGFADDAAVLWFLVSFIGSTALKLHRERARAWLRGEAPPPETL